MSGLIWVCFDCVCYYLWSMKESLQKTTLKCLEGNHLVNHCKFTIQCLYYKYSQTCLSEIIQMHQWFLLSVV